MLGSPNVGVYALATNGFTLVPPQTTEGKAKRLRENLRGEVVRCTVGGTRLIGVLGAANSNGIVLPHMASDGEVEALRGALHGVNVERVEGRVTAFGNLVLANDRGGIVSGLLAEEKDVLRRVADVLGVELVVGEVANLPYVGAAAVATNRGILAHPLLSEAERGLLEEVLKAHVEVGTVNGGCPIVASGLLANDCGAVIGSLTTGPEIMMVSSVFE